MNRALQQRRRREGYFSTKRVFISASISVRNPCISNFQQMRLKACRTTIISITGKWARKSISARCLRVNLISAGDYFHWWINTGLVQEWNEMNLIECLCQFLHMYLKYKGFKIAFLTIRGVDEQSSGTHRNIS